MDNAHSPKHFYQLSSVLPKQITCEMTTHFKYKFTFNNNFMINIEPKACKV